MRHTKLFLLGVPSGEKKVQGAPDGRANGSPCLILADISRERDAEALQKYNDTTSTGSRRVCWGIMGTSLNSSGQEDDSTAIGTEHNSLTKASLVIWWVVGVAKANKTTGQDSKQSINRPLKSDEKNAGYTRHTHAIASPKPRAIPRLRRKINRKSVEHSLNKGWQ